MVFDPPERFNIADYFLGARIAEGVGARPALLTDQGTRTYAEVDRLASRYAHLLREAQVAPEQRVIIALPDGPAFVGALFGILKIGAVVVMVNPQLSLEQIAYFYDYTRATAALVAGASAEAFVAAAADAPALKTVLSVDAPDVERRLEALPDAIATNSTHRDDPAIWLFSGGTTGQPKAVVQTHRSYANTTECYAKGVLGYGSGDVTLAVPKLFFGYALGANLLFPFSVGARAILFEAPSTPEALFALIAQHRPTVLVNVPTMVNRMVSHPDAARQDLTCLRFATSAGEALPVELYHRWKDAFQIELLDGLGTAEMWHIFLTNRVGAVKPGTLGQVVPGFEVKAADDSGTEVPVGDVGLLWVRGNSQGLGYWQLQEKTQRTFRGDWVVCGDLISRDAEGYFTHHGRADEMLKVSGKWLSPQEVESCLLQHPAVREAAVVGVTGDGGLVKPHAYVVTLERRADLAEELKAFVRERLEPFKAPRDISFVDALPRTHLGKVDRGKLRRGAA
ncbi:MAG TPA: benzoate-CoA ligase family protein [Gemmatimonadales bacterium]|nr:benzoate-CoA ligase family protein [Gemmatimonadales bacterium]